MNLVVINRYTRALSVVILTFITGQGAAAEINWIKVKRDGAKVDIRSEFVVHAPANDVYAALLSYDKFAEMGHTFVDSRYIEPAADGTPRIYTRTEGCIVFFCKTIERYARLEIESQQHIRVVAEPERSDAVSSVESWSLRSEGGSTVIEYRHEIDTGFRMPPLLGTMIIRRSVKDGTQKAAVRIQELALASRTVTLASN